MVWDTCVVIVSFGTEKTMNRKEDKGWLRSGSWISESMCAARIQYPMPQIEERAYVLRMLVVFIRTNDYVQH